MVPWSRRSSETRDIPLACASTHPPNPDHTDPRPPPLRVFVPSCEILRTTTPKHPINPTPSPAHPPTRHTPQAPIAHRASVRHHPAQPRLATGTREMARTMGDGQLSPPTIHKATKLHPPRGGALRPAAMDWSNSAFISFTRSGCSKYRLLVSPGSVARS
jgi:hypothetical protein